MCLYVAKEQTEKIKKKKKKGFVLRRKILTIKRGTLRSAIFSRFRWAPGWNVAIGTPRKNRSIYGGAIHVYKSTKRLIFLDRHEVIVTVKCYLKDFIATDGWNEEGYSKVYLTKKDYNKAMSDLQKLKEPKWL